MKFFIATTGIALSFLGACHSENSSSSVSAVDQCAASLALASESPGSHDYVFPDGVAEYKSGTRVLQLKTGRTYECKGFPYTPYCSQWTETSTMFEPGTGSNWMAAWDLK